VGGVRYLVVGAGPAGTAAVVAIRRRDPGGRIVVVAPEAGPPYSRAMLPALVAGRVTLEELAFRPADEFERWGVSRRVARAVRLDRDRRELALSDGTLLPYDRLLLAPGGVPSRPAIPGLGLPGVFVLHEREDAVGILGGLAGADRAVVLGGGLIGLQVAEALGERGLAVDVVEQAPRLLPRLLDRRAAAMVQAAAEQRGVACHLGVSVARALAGEDGRLAAVRLGDGRELTTRMLVVAVGLRPDLSLAAPAGLAAARGILVDTAMHTSAPGVYAAGDVAECADGFCTPLWPRAAEGGRVAGSNMAGGAERRQGITWPQTAWHLFGVSGVALGESAGAAPQDTIYELACGPAYRRLVLREGRLVGALLVGEIRTAGVLAGLMRRGGTHRSALRQLGYAEVAPGG
jgi:NAD(P)H-nitrite reductase large subunit